MKITKAVIPAAGLGTRFLPATKASPKEMMPVVDTPIIQYVIQEAVDSGIKDIIIVTGSHKRNIEDHFDRDESLEDFLINNGKAEQAADIRRIAELANFIYIRQKGPRGNGTPILCAKDLLGKQAFIVLWGDDFIVAQPSRTIQLINTFKKHSGCILACIETDKEEDTNKYGFIKGKKINNNLYQVEELIEKPGPGRAPSNLASVSGYLITSQIFSYLEKQALSLKEDEELYLPKAINDLAKDQPVYALKIENGQYYDTGNKLEYLKANVDFALQRDDLNRDFRKYLEEIIK